MIDFFRAIVILLAGVVVILFIFAMVEIMTDTEWKEDKARRNFMSGYFNRKDDNND